jgi:hypothetical protein
MQGRVKTYRVRRTGGKWFIDHFNESHAREINTTLEADGIALDKAIALVRWWNKMGSRSDWEYYIPFVKKSLTTYHSPALQGTRASN